MFFSASANPSLNMPLELTQQLQSFPLQSHNSLWTKYFNASNAPSDLNPDYLLELRFEEIRIMPEQMQTRTYTESKTIQDGWTYQLNDKGQVQKDSNGNDIKKPKMIQIQCEIRETQQMKDAFLRANIWIRKKTNGEIITQTPLTENIGFRNLYAHANGDLRALTNDSRNKINTQPLPFPPNAQMSTDLVKQCISKLLSHIQRMQTYFQP